MRGSRNELKKTSVLWVFIAFFLFFGGQVSAIDVYIYDLEIVGGGEDNQSTLGPAVQNQLVGTESLIFTFKTIPKSPDNTVPQRIKTVKTTLDALGISFFFGIDYLLFGELTDDQAKKAYSASLKLYNREKHDIVYEVNYSETGADQAQFTRHLALVVNEQMVAKFTGKEELTPQQIVENFERKILEAAKKNDQNKEPDKDKTAETKEGKTEAQLDENTKKSVEETSKTTKELKESIDALNQKVDTIIQDNQAEKSDKAAKGKDRQIHVYLAGGEFINLMGEWATTTNAFVTADMSVLFAIPLLSGNPLDLYLRFGPAANYAQSKQSGTNQYINYIRLNSFIVKADVDLYMLFAKSFGVSIGGGPSFKYMTIDFSNSAGKAMPASAYTLGAFAALGIDWVPALDVLPVGFGVKGIADFVFFTPLSLDIKILAQIILKV
jgi:hypothetical protein